MHILFHWVETWFRWFQRFQVDGNDLQQLLSRENAHSHETARFFKEISSTRRDGLTILNIQNRMHKWEINMDILKMMIH